MTTTYNHDQHVRRERVLTDAQLREKHGDHATYSIAQWRAEYDAGETELQYIDWRADRLWCAAGRA